MAVCLLWGTTYLAIRVAIETIPPLLMAGFRWTIAGAIILAVLKIRGQVIPPPSHWRALTVLGVLLIGLGNGCVVWAEQTVTSVRRKVTTRSMPKLYHRASRSADREGGPLGPRATPWSRF